MGYFRIFGDISEIWRHFGWGTNLGQKAPILIVHTPESLSERVQTLAHTHTTNRATTCNTAVFSGKLKCYCTIVSVQDAVTPVPLTQRSAVCPMVTQTLLPILARAAIPEVHHRERQLKSRLSSQTDR